MQLTNGKIGATLILLFFSIYTTGQNVPLSAIKLEEKLMNQLIETQKTLDWTEVDNHTKWSALVLSDSIAAIGYQPTEYKNLRSNMHLIDVMDAQWTEARNKVINRILALSNDLNNTNLKQAEILPYGIDEKLPHFFVKIENLEVLEELSQMPELRYIEPTSYSITSNRSGEGCGDNSSVIDPVDYTTISPDAIQPWHHFEHMIDDAWDKSDQGEGIWVAVMDTGVSDDNPKFNADWDEGESSGRSIEKLGFYQNDGWEDECGHGSAMCGFVAAPRGFDQTPAGVAYRANLVSYRVTNDVRINTSAEQDGLSNALVHAGDDPKIKIISISLGDAFSSGVVEDGIIYAHNAGKLIFAAAGTSTTFTNWYGVIFPADMPETVAVTGAVENSNFEECDICHTGNEVDFTVYMERDASGNKAPTLTNDNSAGPYNGYVGGSSAGTAIMAGMAALVWGNNPTYNKDQIFNRLILTSSNYPDRDDEFGWGAVDACAAVDTSFNLPCASSLSNEVTMEITSITFPSTSDTGGDAEWVMTFDTQQFYFNVPESGATGNPASFIDQSICGSNIPIIIDLGVTMCGDISVPMFVESYEDDSATSNCDYDDGWWFNSDDDLSSETITVQLSDTSFVHSSSAGDFIIEYVLSCSPLLIAAISDDSPTCHGDNIEFVASPAGETNYEFFLDANNNNLIDAGESLQSGSSNIYNTTSLVNGDEIGVEITGSNGCSDISITSVFVSPIHLSGADMLVGTVTGIADFETDGIIESIQTIDANSIVDYDSQTEITLLSGFETVNGCEFLAFIDGCDLGGGGQNAQEESEQEEDIENK